MHAVVSLKCCSYTCMVRDLVMLDLAVHMAVAKHHSHDQGCWMLRQILQHLGLR